MYPTVNGRTPGGEKALAKFRGAVFADLIALLRSGESDQAAIPLGEDRRAGLGGMTPGECHRRQSASPSLDVGGRELNPDRAANSSRSGKRQTVSVARYPPLTLRPPKAEGRLHCQVLAGCDSDANDETSRLVAPTSGHLYECLGSPNS